MKELIKNYVKEELKNLRYVGDKVKLQNVNPSLLEEVIGDFEDPYELNGYDCDYWASVGDYSIFGSMRFGTAEITLERGEVRRNCNDSKDVDDDENSELKTEQVIPEEAKSWSTFYFTFGYGQFNYGSFQPIKAENQSKAHKKMVEVYGTSWSFVYNETEWQDVIDRNMSKPLEILYAI